MPRCCRLYLSLPAAQKNSCTQTHKTSKTKSIHRSKSISKGISSGLKFAVAKLSVELESKSSKNNKKEGLQKASPSNDAGVSNNNGNCAFECLNDMVLKEGGGCASRQVVRIPDVLAE
jgi:hypothetical protein